VCRGSVSSFAKRKVQYLRAYFNYTINEAQSWRETKPIESLHQGFSATAHAGWGFGGDARPCKALAGTDMQTWHVEPPQADPRGQVPGS